MPTDNQSSEPTSDEAKGPETHPWGDNFDAATAWKALTTAREAERVAKAELATYRKAEQDKADAEKTDLQKALDRVAELEGDLKTTRRDAILAKSGLDEKLHGFITGENDEDIAKQIEALTAALGDKGKEAKDDDADADSGDVKPSSRPQAALTPGHGGDEAPFDADAIVAASR